MLCPNCSAYNPDDNRFCSQCATALERTQLKTLRRKRVFVIPAVEKLASPTSHGSARPSYLPWIIIVLIGLGVAYWYLYG